MDPVSQDGPARRRYVSKACKACRTGKTKCDGELPMCGLCRRKSRPCVYNGDDKRKLPFRSALRVVRSHIDSLTDQLAILGSATAPIAEDDFQLANRVLEAVELPTLPTNTGAVMYNVQGAISNPTTTTPGSNAAHSAAAQSVGGSNPSPVFDPTAGDMFAGPWDDSMSFGDLSQLNWDDSVSLDWPWMEPFAPESDLPFNLGDVSNTTQLGLEVNVTAEDVEEDEVDQDLVNEIAARAGALQVAPDGKLRYFGSSSNVHLLNNTAPGPYSKPRSLAIEGVSALRAAGLDQAVDTNIETHLLNLFFSWYNSCHPIIERSFYWAKREKCEQYGEDDGFYSAVLSNAMCAIGASYEGRYHPNLVTFPRPLAEFFADRAKTLLEIELDSPSVSTVQALLLLSSHEVGFQRTARAWLYSGMAMRLCFDLGLHVAADSYVEQGILTPIEAEARRMAFWASYVLNYRASFSLGRPFTLNASDITAQKPSGTFQRSTWKGHWRNAFENTNKFATQADGTPDQIGLICEQRSLLANIVEPIARALYGNTKIDIKTTKEIFDEATAAMVQWKQNLPLPLNPRGEAAGSIIPQVLVLHLEYYYLRILVHRPWTSQRLHPYSLKSPDFRHARQTCISSASKMASILADFEKCFGYRYMDVETCQMLPSAALILIFATVSVADQDPHSSEITGHLNVFLRALDELGTVYASAKALLDSLLVIQGRWYSVYKRRQDKKQDHSRAMSTDMGRPSKRLKNGA